MIEIKKAKTTVGNSMRTAKHALQQELFGDHYNHYKRYINIVVIGALIVILSTVIAFGYRWYIVAREQAAQQGLITTLGEYVRIAQSGKKEEWEYGYTLFKLEHDQHTRSYLSPYFMTLEADALYNQGKHEEAIALMKQAVAALPSDGPTSSLYTMKYALMLTEVAATREEGLAILKKLAEDTHNKNQDAALFYLGNYYKSQGDYEQAHATWQQLIDAYKNYTGFASSGWVAQAQENIKTLAV